MRSPGLERAVLALALILSVGAPCGHANLLRNPDFQDDWLTLLPENQNHHWCYSTGFQNRRDYNPDGWFLSGNWTWQDADGPRGSRRLILEGPRSEVRQRVNWVLVHDDRRREGFPDAGGFPAAAPQRSHRPLTLVRDLILRVRMRGDRVPGGSGTLEIGLAPAGRIAESDPFGAWTPLAAAASTELPTGTFEWRWVEVRLPASAWLKAAQAAAAKSPQEAAESTREGLVLPGVVHVAIRFEAAAGRIELDRAELTGADPQAPNLLPFGGFETATKEGGSAGWSGPRKYRYFPPALYYLFNTWHNGPAGNRGLVARDSLVPRSGGNSLKMVVPSGDEVQVASAPIPLNQTEARLIEVSAWVKTDRLNMMQIDGLSETGERLDGFNFIHKAPVSIGTDEWRQVRQVFKPRKAIRSLRLVLAARGVNGYTLGDTGETPQAHATGTVWWDDLQVFEPESTAAELATRGVKAASPTAAAPPAPHLEDLDVGERMFGPNLLRATIVNGDEPRTLSLLWRFTAPDGRRRESRSVPRSFAAGERAAVTIPYELPPGLLSAYSEHKGELRLQDGTEGTLAASELWFSTWSTPLDLELGALYLTPEQRQLVRLNLGLSAKAMDEVASVRLDLVRRRSGEVLKSVSVAAGPRDIAAQRQRIPMELREDFTNLLLADFDVSEIPVQDFAGAERRWFVRATIVDRTGREIFSTDSRPFCRQERAPAQAGVRSVRLDRGNLLYVNDQPFLPWGAAYGHVPVHDGGTLVRSQTFRDLGNLPPWSIYDGFTSRGYTRANAGFSTVRHVAGSITGQEALESSWNRENLVAATAFVAPSPVFSLDELARGAGGAAALEANLAFLRTAPMVVSVAPGIEEAFGLFHSANAGRIAGLRSVVEALRRSTGKPVMVGHGGYWNRFEFERVPFFDIYDPETEPLYPANLHTDLSPLVAGQEKTIWLRPQMYEDVPFERWRFHLYVELMRGARGFQVAHGPGDVSLFRGLGGELEGLKQVLWSKDPGPEIRVSPSMEHWSRRLGDRTYLIAATTRGLTLGTWRYQGGVPGPFGRPRITEDEAVVRSEANSYGIGEESLSGPSLHGIQYLPGARRYPRGSRLVQWVHLDPQAPPGDLGILLKADGRFTHAASWGDFNPTPFRRGTELDWFLRSFYRHANGFLGWGRDLLSRALDYVPDRTTRLGDLPPPGSWTKLTVDLSAVGVRGELIDGVAFVHHGGRVSWGRTTIETGSDTQVLWGDALAAPPDELARTRIAIQGLKAGTRIKVLFEDREIVAEAGYFIDDFRGADVYQRFGGGPGVGYGNDPVALHVYEIP